MFNARKIIKGKGEELSDLEEEVAKILYDYEMQAKDAKLKENLALIHVSAAEEFSVTQRNDEKQTCILIRIPYRCLSPFKKVRANVTAALEKKLNAFVFVVAVRKIWPKYKPKTKARRPRNRTLTAVHEKLLEDVCLPANISGKQTRLHVDGTRTLKIFLDYLDKSKVEDRLDAMAECYRKLTHKRVNFNFSKPTTFQKEYEEFKKRKGQ